MPVKPLILLIDDDADHRRVLRHLIESLYPGARVDEYHEALAPAHDHVPDIQSYALVIADNRVAGQDSMGWVKVVLAEYPEKPAIIILSSVADMNPMVAQQMVIAVKQGVTNFYFKK